MTLPRSLAPLLRAGLPLLLVLVLGAIFNADGAFFRWNTHRALLREISVHGILASGMTLVIIAGGIDLAVGSVLSLAAVGIALLSLHLGWSAPLAIGSVVLLGLASGVASGTLIAVFRVPAFISTLSLMVFARGLAKYCSGGQKISTYAQQADGTFRTLATPEWFSALDARIFGDQVSLVSVIFALCALATWLVLSRLRIGRYLYAVGGNAEAARLAGVPVRLSLMIAYGLAGVFSAIAGICQAAQETQGDPETGFGYELDAIAMVVLGGTSLSGGRGGMGLTLVGILTLGYLQKVLSLNAFSTEARLMLTGLILLGAVLFQRRSRTG